MKLSLNEVIEFGLEEVKTPILLERVGFFSPLTFYALHLAIGDTLCLSAENRTWYIKFDVDSKWNLL